MKITMMIPTETAIIGTGESQNFRNIKIFISTQNINIKTQYQKKATHTRDRERERQGQRERQVELELENVYFTRIVV